jgi:ATP-dependent Clp endopeptidase proteolytic subunit ClpP
MRPCFNFKNSADATAATLSIYDEIGLWGVQAADFRAALASVKAPVINLEINSPGGDVFAGIAIYNMLKASGKTIATKVMGVAASAASLIAMAGDTIEMPKNTFMMVHNPISGVYGNAEKLRETAEVLDKIGDSITATYVNRTGKDEAEMKAMLSKDTWLTADEALEHGFATVVTDEIKADASFDMGRADLPANVAAVFAKATKTAAELQAEQEAETARLAQVEADRVAAEAARVAAEAAALAAASPVAKQINDLAIAAGLPDQAAFLAISCESLEVAQARIKTAGEIVAFYAFAKKPEQADAAIRANKTVADVRAALVAEMAEADVHTSNVRRDAAANASLTAQPVASTNDIWAKRK